MVVMIYLCEQQLCWSDESFNVSLILQCVDHRSSSSLTTKARKAKQKMMAVPRLLGLIFISNKYEA